MPQQLERRSISQHPKVEEREDGSPMIQGYAAVFNSKTNIFDMFTESIRPGAFSRAIAEKHDTRHLLNHDANFVLGRTKNGTLVLRETMEGLWTETTPPNTQQAKDVVENIRVGNIDQMSFAFVIRKQEWTRGKDGQLDHREVIDVDLFDVSSVTYPAYEATSVGVRSSAEELYRHVREEWQKQADSEKPLVLRGVFPEVVLARLKALRLK